MIFNCTKRKLLKSSFLVLLSFPWNSGFALGFRIPNQDAEAIARGNAFIATADNPSAIYYNPAGITQIPGHEFRAGMHNLAINSEYKSLDGASSERSESEIASVPEIYYTYSPEGQKFSFGFGVYAPYGLGLEWPDDAPFRDLALEGRLLYATVNPVVAWKLLPNLSIAAGPTLNYSTVLLKQGIGLSTGDEFKFEGDGWAFGASAGLLWKPHAKWALGVVYHSPTTVDFGGDSRARPYTPEEPTWAEVDFPQWVGMGLAFRPTERWSFEVWADWTDWDTLEGISFRKASGDVPRAFNWESSFLAGIGGTRTLGKGWFVSAGYFFSEKSTPDKDFTPMVPDTDLHVGSVGFGYRGSHWRFAIAGQLITGPWRTIDQSQGTSPSGQTADGRYQWFNQSVNVAVGYSF